MNNGLKLLLMAAGAIVTCIVVVVGFQLTKSGKSDTNKASEQYAAMMSDYDEVKLTVYENTTASGSDVVNFIKDNAATLVSGGIDSIVVNTKAGGTQSYGKESANVTVSPTPTGAGNKIPDTDILKDTVDQKQKDNTAIEYINPKGKFFCSVSRNKNGIVSVVTFKQQ